MIKEYKTIDEQVKAYKLPAKDGYHSFITTCIDCGSYLSKNSDLDYIKDWQISYTCDKCNSKFVYQPSDMGQTFPYLAKYDDKSELFK